MPTIIVPPRTRPKRRVKRKRNPDEIRIPGIR